jgi:single-strand DNA-binding protein
MSDQSFKTMIQVTDVGDVQTFPSGFTKRVLKGTTLDPKYPQPLEFEFVKDSANKINGIGVGELVEVSFDIRGREYNGRTYITLGGWHVKRETGATVKTPKHESDAPIDVTGGLMADEKMPF